MRCPFCSNENTKVIDSRPTEMGEIRRRRQCEKCDRRFTTYERVESIPLMVVKKDDTREPYDREKVKSGIMRSCHKRPVSAAQIDSMTDAVENAIYNMDKKEIHTSDIGELVMQQLKDVDEVAYVRFASVYREFKDVNTYIEEIQKFLNK